ncbi:unnamed protein product [Prunus brigantina]
MYLLCKIWYGRPIPICYLGIGFVHFPHSQILIGKKPENNWGHCASAVTRKPHRLSSVRFWVSSKQFWSVEMCNYQPWEEDSLQSEDYAQSTAEGVDVAETRWGARLAMLEARVTRVEARVERLEAKMLHLQKGMRVVCALFLVTLMYAIFK